MSHDHYFRDVSGLNRIDVYRILDLFGVTCPVAQHVVKKALVAGQRGHKSTRRDWQDIADSAARKLEMIDEDVAVIMAACGGNGANELTPKLDPVVVANAAAFNSNWQEVRDAARMVVEMDGEPNEQRRQDAAAEDEAWKAIEARMDAIGQNGNDSEHYQGRVIGCATCHGRGRVQNHIGSMECPACHGCASCECRP